MSLDPDGLIASVVGMPSREAEGWKIVDPAAPAKSYLLAKIKGEAGILGKRMPLNREPLSAEQINQIENWIRGLAGESASDEGAGIASESGGGPQARDGDHMRKGKRKVREQDPRRRGTPGRRSGEQRW